MMASLFHDLSPPSLWTVIGRNGFKQRGVLGHRTLTAFDMYTVVASECGNY